jgi:plasmid maintenance system antidote protein VapI
MNTPSNVSHALLDNLLNTQNLRNDAALSRFLEVNPPVVSKIRHGRMPVGASMIINIHEKTGMSIKDIKFLLAQAPQQKEAA